MTNMSKETHKEKGKRRKPKVTRPLVMDLKRQGLSNAKIGRMFGTTRQHIWNLINLAKIK